MTTDNIPALHVVEFIIPDPDVWPTDYSRQVKRFALVDERGVVWLHRHQFGLLQSMKTADRTSSDARQYFRKTAEEAEQDRFYMEVDPNGDLVEQAFRLFEWPRAEELIGKCGIIPVIDAYFEASGSSVVRDFNYPAWTQQAVTAFGPYPELRERALYWLDHAERCLHMPTMYKLAGEKQREDNWYAAIRYAATKIIERLDTGEAIP